MLAVLVQISALILIPAVKVSQDEGSSDLVWATPVSILLLSIVWWENYIDKSVHCIHIKTKSNLVEQHMNSVEDPGFFCRGVNLVGHVPTSDAATFRKICTSKQKNRDPRKPLDPPMELVGKSNKTPSQSPSSVRDQHFQCNRTYESNNNAINCFSLSSNTDFPTILLAHTCNEFEFKPNVGRII